MSFSYLDLSENQRLFLIGFATSGSVADTLAEMISPKTKQPGMSKDAYKGWRDNPQFLLALEALKADPEWVHKNIWRPWMLALDDQMMLHRALGIVEATDKNGKVRTWLGLSDKKREQLLQEHDMLTRGDDKQDLFADFMKGALKALAAPQQQQIEQTAPIIDLVAEPKESSTWQT